MENTKLFAVHVQGIMPATDSMIVNATSPFHAIDIVHAMVKVDRSRIWIIKKHRFYSAHNGELRPVLFGDAVAQPMAKKIINKF